MKQMFVNYCNKGSQACHFQTICVYMEVISYGGWSLGGGKVPCTCFNYVQKFTQTLNNKIGIIGENKNSKTIGI